MGGLGRGWVQPFANLAVKSFEDGLGQGQERPWVGRRWTLPWARRAKDRDRVSRGRGQEWP